MDRKKALHILEILKSDYPDAKCALEYDTPYQLAVATVLSAQCTDKRVNIVTEELFALAPTPEKIENLGEESLRNIIQPCGLSKTKAKNIIGLTAVVLSKYKGDLPETFEELTALPGVGPKTANVILSNAFGQDAIAVDTHVFRVSNRLGLAHSKNVEATEKDLNAILPKEEWSLAHHLIIRHGRNVCSARKPKCHACSLLSLCESELAWQARNNAQSNAGAAEEEALK